MIYVSLVLRNSEEEKEEGEEEKEKQEKKEVGETRGRRRMQLGIRSAEERDKSETRAPFFFGSRPHTQHSYFPTWFSSLMPLPKSPPYDIPLEETTSVYLKKKKEEEEEEEEEEKGKKYRKREKERKLTRAKEQRQIF
ncbi:hypothetical protein V1477_001816, partial [Vespula maculifrons]